ncbi:MAG: hypothetical protein PHH70_00215 [Candidatus Gracilibacteria bacterium]|nr:hypothetical protein [Candidatus Gracilibacteria bacterium]
MPFIRYFSNTFGLLTPKFIPFIPWTISFLAGVHRMNLVVFVLMDIVAGYVIFGGIYWGFSGGVHIVAQLLNIIH